MTQSQIPAMTVPEARDVILKNVSARGTERVRLDQCLARVLREAVLADRDLPPFNRSAMDGYAVTLDDAFQGAKLTVVGRVRAGEWPNAAIGRGQAMSVMTGAPVPDGASAVIPIEKTSLAGNEVTLLMTGQAAANIAPRGCEATQGTCLVSSGSRLRGPDLAVLASVGAVAPLVGTRPRVALIVTGDEVIPPKETPGRAQIRNANGPAVAMAIAEAGGEVKDLGIVRDSREALDAAIDEGLRSDVLVLSGGVSAGDFDFVEDSLAAFGARFHVTSVRVKPGAPFVYATRGDTHIFGLPGNPVSAQVTFELFVRPGLLRWQGARDLFRPTFSGTLLDGLKNRSGRENYLPVRVLWSPRGFEARAVRTQGSGDVAAHARANALAVLAHDRIEASPGETVPLYPLGNILDAVAAE